MTIEQEQAFRSLQQLVSELHAKGSRRVGARLKAEFLMRSSGAFKELDLGYPKFSAFLRAAEAAGYVRLTPSGPDLEAWPVATPCQSPPEPGRVRNSIRPDLWLAFLDFAPGFVRFYDKTGDRAYKLPHSTFPGESSQTLSLRSRFQAHDPSLVPLEPISQTLIRDWMRSFAARQTGTTGDQLRIALDEDHPLQSFTRIVRSEPGIFREWHGERVERAAEFIRSSLARMGVQTQVTVPYDPIVSKQASSGEAAASQKSSTSQAPSLTLPELQFLSRSPSDLVHQIDSLVDRLLALRGTLTFLQDRRHEGAK